MINTGQQSPTLDRREAQRLSGLGISAFDSALRRGIFPHIKVGRRVLIPRAKFMAILEGRDNV